VKPKASQPRHSLSQLLCRKHSSATSRRVVDLSRVFQNELQAKILAFPPEINLTGQSDVVGQSAQSIG
jgi:hypothetical protein